MHLPCKTHFTWIRSSERSVFEDTLAEQANFSQCYQMVLKSYSGNKKRDFDLEKEAFSGLQSTNEVPILRYLGSYTHDYGEGNEAGETYNLLLEYAENDLYQAWADETNVPPVQAQEILQSWRSLFKVAEAIHYVHNLEIRRGKGRPWNSHGYVCLVPWLSAVLITDLYKMACRYQTGQHSQRARTTEAG